MNNGFFISSQLLKYSIVNRTALLAGGVRLRKLNAPSTNNTILTIPTTRQINSINNNKNFEQRKHQTPELIYVPHILRWLRTKIRFKYLQRKWDPQFSEGAFIYGSTHAICRITQIIRNNNNNSEKNDELAGLLTDEARTQLIADIAKHLTRKQKDIIEIKPADIKILIPINVQFDDDDKGKDKGTKRCTITMRALALKWFDDEQRRTEQVHHRLVLIALETEFTRDYNVTLKPEWTISKFKVLECGLLTTKQ